MVKHSIITWDSSFRNFFHLIDSLSQQDYDLSHVEVVFVEQRSEKTAQSVADLVGVESIRQVSQRMQDRLAITLIYMDEPDSVPYHPGRLLNEGLRKAGGEILSTMDADSLVPPNFLQVLDLVHDAGNVVTCMYRHSADRPCGVSKKNWTRQIIDYQLVLRTCPDFHVSVPAKVSNKAPLLSARRENWEAIQFYDEHRIFSTAYTLFGQDISMRFGLLLGDVQLPLPVAAVHPWHPTEVNRSQGATQILYQTQMKLMDWATKNHCYNGSKRHEFADQLYEQHQEQIESAIQIAEMEMIQHARYPLNEKISKQYHTNRKFAIMCPHCKETLYVTHKGHWVCPCCKVNLIVNP